MAKSTKKLPGNPQLLVRIPQEISGPLARECAKRNCTAQTIVIESLNDRFGVDAPLPRAGGQPRERRKSARDVKYRKETKETNGNRETKS